MRVLSWTIHCMTGGRRRVGAIADVIARHAPDVVALQEVSAEDSFPDALASALCDRGLVGCEIGRPPPGARKR
jgi:endonuclease/exonuclease/phosphatase family metal-dependent hydrolase